MAKAKPFTRELGEEIARRYSSGEPLSSITKDKHIPCYATIQYRIRKIDWFADLMAKAKEQRSAFIGEKASKSVHYVHRNAHLYDDEHTPEFPTPSAPSPKAIMQNVGRENRLKDKDYFTRGDLDPEAPLDFN